MCKKMFIAKGKVLGMAVCICLLSGLLSGCGKTGDEKDTPTVNSGATIEPAPEATLVPEPAPEAVLTPEPAPEATLAPTPEPTSKPTPVPTPEPTPKPSPNPFNVSLVQKGTVKDNGEYKGLDWLVTDAGELVVTGQMEGNGLDSAAIWQDAPWNQYSKEITSACLNFTGAKSLQDLFYGYSALSEVDLVNLDTSSVTNMTAMFQNCTSLGSIDVSGFDTSSVTGMSNMFCGCTSLGNIDVSSFDTSSVRGMSYMFCSCESVVSLDLSGFDTSSVQNMDCMFASCRSLQEILTGEQWLQPNRVERMFYNCNITSVTRK